MLALAGALLLAGCAAGGAGSPQASGQEERQGTEEDPERASKEQLGHPSLGSAEAPVVLTEYSDYQ